MSDPELTLAHPAGDIEAFGDSFRALDAVLDVIRGFDVSRVVIGLPLLLNGEEGSSAHKARRWGRSLGRRLEMSPQGSAEPSDSTWSPAGGGFPAIVFQDERLSTVTAHGHLRQASIDGRRHRPFVDQESAVIILQSALDATTGNPPRKGDLHVG
ncbi:RuvX/YqgF family protein [uncultured Bifidobacterium sp.]|uniref:RuvX/YqgF family protein n=1 Tax=uncultured Bifidobacterium sp. TaxID=165187 RepID=UPI0037DDC590